MATVIGAGSKDKTSILDLCWLYYWERGVYFLLGWAKLGVSRPEASGSQSELASAAQRGTLVKDTGGTAEPYHVLSVMLPWMSQGLQQQITAQKQREGGGNPQFLSLQFFLMHQ